MNHLRNRGPHTLRVGERIQKLSSRRRPIGLLVNSLKPIPNADYPERKSLAPVLSR